MPKRNYYLADDIAGNEYSKITFSWNIDLMYVPKIGFHEKEEESYQY